MLQRTIDILKDAEVDDEVLDEFDRVLNNLVCYVIAEDRLNRVLELIPKLVEHLPEDLARELIDIVGGDPKDLCLCK